MPDFGRFFEFLIATLAFCLPVVGGALLAGICFIAGWPTAAAVFLFIGLGVGVALLAVVLYQNRD